MSERGVFILEEYLANNPGLDKEEIAAVNDGIKAMQPKDETEMSPMEGAKKINAEIGATMSDDVPIEGLSRGLGHFGLPHEEVVDAYRTLVGSLPKNVRVLARRSINAAAGGFTATVGQLREERDEDLLTITNMGQHGLTFLKTAFAKPKPRQ